MWIPIDCFNNNIVLSYHLAIVSQTSAIHPRNRFIHLFLFFLPHSIVNNKEQILFEAEKRIFFQKENNGKWFLSETTPPGFYGHCASWGFFARQEKIHSQKRPFSPDFSVNIGGRKMPRERKTRLMIIVAAKSQKGVKWMIPNISSIDLFEPFFILADFLRINYIKNACDVKEIIYCLSHRSPTSWS